MNWLTPLAGLYLALAVIPPLILLYFLKLRRRPQPIACTLLWKKAVEDLRANAPFQRLRRSLLLFLQLLALLLLIGAIMQPQLQGGRGKGGRQIILIDNSASMTATDGPDGSTRLDEAKRQARERIEEIYGGGVFGGSAGETMVIAFSNRAEVLCQFTSSKSQLLDAIDRIEPSHGQTTIAEALKLARAFATNVVDAMGEARPTDDPATIELYSDGRIEDLAGQVLRGETLSYHSVGAPEADNVAIGSISAERPFDQPTAIQVFVALLNFNPSEARCRLELSIDGDVGIGGIEDVTIGPATTDPSTGALVPGRNNIVFEPFEQPRGSIIAINNVREDDLVADNTAQLVVPPAQKLRVAIVAQKGMLIRNVLDGMPLDSITPLTEQQFQRAAEAGLLDQYDVIVLDSVALETMPPGRYLSFGPTPPVEGLNEFGEGGNQFILDAQDAHPALRFVSTDDVYIAKSTLLQPAEDVRILADGNRGPVIVEVARGPLKLIHVTFDPAQSNWPLLRSWVTFIYNTVEYLGLADEAVASEGLEPGEAITTRLPSSAREVTVQGPDGPPEPCDVGDPALFSWGPTRLAGLYTLHWTDAGAEEPQTRAFAVNLLSETEGNIAPLSVIEIGQEAVVRSEAGDSRYTALWPWALGVCLAVLMIEWWVYHRKAFL